MLDKVKHKLNTKACLDHKRKTILPTKTRGSQTFVKDYTCHAFPGNMNKQRPVNQLVHKQTNILKLKSKPYIRTNEISQQ